MGSRQALSRVTSAAASAAAADAVRHDDARLVGGGGSVAAHAATHASGGSDPVTPAAIGAAAQLIPTSTKTAAYTAVPGEYVRADATTAAFTVTIPAATLGAVIGVRKIDTSANAVTVSDGGSLNTTLRVVDEARTMIGLASGWVMVNSLITLTGLDTRYLRSTQNLLELNNVSTARTNLGLGGAAVLSVGTAAGTVAAGDDARLSDARTPTAHAHAGTDISSGTVPYARLPVGTAASTVAAGDDARLTNARTPTAHAASHATGQSDALSPGAIGAAATAHDHFRPVSTKTANYTLVDTDGIVLANTSAGGFTVTLPTAVGRAGRSFMVKKIGGNPLTIASNGGTVDGNASESLSASMAFRELTSDGTNWFITGGRADPFVVTGLTVANGATLTLDSTAGHIFRVSATGAAWTLAAPSNPVDADVMNIEVVASVATSITINSAILLTTGISATVAVAINKRWFGGLRYVNGVGWFLLASQVQS